METLQITNDRLNGLSPLIGNTPLQLEVTLLRTSTYQSKNTPGEHLQNF